MNIAFLRHICIVAAVSVLPTTGLAEGNGPHSVAVYWENDGSHAKPNRDTDRHYTNGAALAYTAQPAFVQPFAHWPVLNDQFDQAAFGLIAGHLIFTPEDIASTTEVTDDRPYAGYLFIGAFMQRTGPRTLDHVQVDLGLVGPSALGEEVQNSVHGLRGFDEANGWDHQLGDEPTLQVFLRRKWKLVDDPHFQVIPSADVALGTVYRHVQGNVLFRAGWNLPDDFGPGRLADPSVTWSASPQGLGVYGFARLGGRVVEHDLFIEGNNFESSPGRDANVFVGEIQGGLVVRWQHGRTAIEASYSQTFVSETFDDQHGSDAYGAINVAVQCAF